MPRRAPVKVLMQGGKWQLPVGQSLPDLREPPPDPMRFAEKLAVNGLLPPARVKEAMGLPGDGDSPARRTQKKHQAVGICERCGQGEALATKRYCGDCRDEHNAITRGLKRRLAAHGLCVDCGAKNNTEGLLCADCRAKQRKRK